METLQFFDQDQLQPITNRIKPSAGRPFPLMEISDTDFENLIFWLYKTEITDGNWKSTYDKILLMQSSSDKARDCSIYRDGEQRAVIQCKHSVINKALTIDMFAKEILKFGLYSIVFPDDIKITRGFKYYIASSAGFNDNCDAFITNFTSELVSNTKIETWAETVIKSYSSLNKLVYKDLENELKARLQLLDIERIDGHEINRLLNLQYQTSTVKAFFDVRMVVDKSLLEPMAEQLSEIVLALNANTQEEKSTQAIKRPFIQFKRPLYLPRYVYKPEEELTIKLMEIRRPLLDYVIDNQYIALLGWGLIGKTSELEHLAELLSGPTYDYHVFYKKLDVFSDSDEDIFILDVNYRPQEKIVLILDGLDEILPEYYSKAVINIKKFMRDFSTVKIVISCRDNFFNVFAGDTKYNTLPKFTLLKLLELDTETINDYLASNPNIEPTTFIRKVRENDLAELVKIPFYLIKFVTKYLSSGRIYNGKTELFEELILEGIKDDIRRRYTQDFEAHEKRLRTALEKLSFVMELQGKNFFTKKDLDEIFRSDQYTVNLISIAGSILNANDLPDGFWRFRHHNMQEYLAAVVLSRLDIKEIKTLITRDPKQLIIKPMWAHTISFLVNLLSTGSETRNALIDLLVINEPGLFMKFEPDKLTDEIRFTVFQKIFNTYQDQDRRLHRTKFEPSELARFSQTSQSLEFVLNVLNNPISQNQLKNALEITAFYELKHYPALKKNFKTAISLHFSNPDDYTKFLATRALIQLFRLSSTEFSQLFVLLSNQKNTWLRYILFHALWQQGFAEQYLPFIFIEIQQLILEERRSFDSSEETYRLGDEHFELMRCIKSLKSVDAISKLIDFWRENLGALSHSIYYRDVIPYMFEQVSNRNLQLHFEKICEIFLENYLQFYGNYDNKDFIRYIKSVGRQFEVLKALMQLKHDLNYVDIKIISWFYDDQALGYLESRFLDASFSLDSAKLFQRVLEEKNEGLVVSFNAMINKYQPLPLPVKVDYHEIHNKLLRRKTSCIFNLQIFKDEVVQLYDQSKKSSLSFDDLHSITATDNVEEDFKYWLFKTLERRNGYGVSYEKSEVLSTLEHSWEQTWISRVYLFSKDNVQWQPDEPELAIIKGWVNQNIDSIDFSKGINSSSWGFDEESDKAIIISYFIRKFDLKDYGKQKYLDMLSLQRWLDTAKDIFEFVTSVVDPSSIEERVLDNLHSCSLYNQVLSNHINYVVKHNLKSAINLLIPYLENNETYEWANVLSAYRTLGGPLESLASLLPTLNDYHRNTLILALIDENSPSIETYLTDKLQTEAELNSKLTFAKYLIMLQNREGLVTYFDYIKFTRTVPDISAPGNPLYYVIDIKLLNLSLQIFEFAFSSDLVYDSMSDLRTISTQMLQNIALKSNAFNEFETQIKDFLAQRKEEQSKVFSMDKQSMLEHLEYTFEGIEHQYFLSNETPLTLSDALTFSEMILG